MSSLWQDVVVARQNLCLVTGRLSDKSQSCQLANVDALNNHQTLSSMFGLGSASLHA